MKQITKNFKVIIASICFCIVLMPVCAEAMDQSNEQEARELFEAGTVLFNQGKFDEAANAFREAYTIKPSWKIWFNIAQSEAAAKRYDLALEAFEKYLIEAGDEIPAKKEQYVRDEIVTLKSRIGYLDFQLADNLKIQVDRVVRGVTPLAGTMRVVAGRAHHLLVYDGTTIVLERDIKVGSQETLIVSLMKSSLSPQSNPRNTEIENDPSIAAPDAGKDTNRKLKIIGWSLVATGVAANMVGIVTGAKALSTADSISEKCPNDICSSADDVALKDKGQNLGTATNILLITGVAAIASGTVMLILQHRRKSEKVTRKTDHSLTQWNISPWGIGGSF